MGLSKLHDFFYDLQNSSNTLDRFLHELEGLRRTVTEVTGNESSVHANSSLIASLMIHLEDCAKDVEKWLEVAQKKVLSQGTQGHGHTSRNF